MLKLKVLIADDHSSVRQGLQSFLSLDSQIEVIGIAVNGVGAVQKTRELKPDVVLMDLLMPEMDGIEATAIIKREMPGVRVLVLTSVLETSSISKALKAGADGYVLKNIEATDLCQTIKSIGNGLVSISLEAVQQFTTGSKQHPASTSHLSARELEVLRMVAQGKANKEIAHELVLSEGTVKTHVSVIMSKLGFQSRTQAALYANEQGLLKHN